MLLIILKKIRNSLVIFLNNLSKVYQFYILIVLYIYTRNKLERNLPHTRNKQIIKTERSFFLPNYAKFTLHSKTLCNCSNRCRKKIFTFLISLRSLQRFKILQICLLLLSTLICILRHFIRTLISGKLFLKLL